MKIKYFYQQLKAYQRLRSDFLELHKRFKETAAKPEKQ